jgi:cytochrome c oxidase assembly protein subunit 15
MNENKAVIFWLLSGCFLIFTMVVIGGITRLTHSGLSMVNWNLFMGVIPPLNNVQWQETFELYKTSPEYLKVNYNFTLNEFKSIFFLCTYTD